MFAQQDWDLRTSWHPIPLPSVFLPPWMPEPFHWSRLGQRWPSLHQSQRCGTPWLTLSSVRPSATQPVPSQPNQSQTKSLNTGFLSPHFFFFCTIKPAYYLNKLESSSSNDALCWSCLSWPSGFGDFLMLLLFPLKKGMVIHLKKTESFLPKNALSQVWLKLVHWFRWRILIFH